MISIPWKRAKEILNAIEKQRILVIGDIMLDQYLWGSVNRISPEAPVPVVEIGSESIRLGGAANVANNIRSLGASPILVGVIGDDRNGEHLKRELEKQSISSDSLIIDRFRPTTIKTRVIAHHQHVLRTDRESSKPVSNKLEIKIIHIIRDVLTQADAVLIQDYNKGFVTKGIIKEVTALIKKRKKILTVDPKIDHFFDYVGATVFKPNEREIEQALQIKIEDEETLERAGKRVLKRLQCSCLLVTRGERGMVLFEKSGAVTHVPTRAKEVYDVSGAGDTAIGVLTAALAAGATITEAATFANYGAGLVCGEVGIVPLAKDKLAEALKTVGK